MSENIDELRTMLSTFRVSELQMLLGFAGRNKSGRKYELLQRAIELIRVRPHPIHEKIRELYKTIHQNGAANSIALPTVSPGNKETPPPPNITPTMPQPQGNVPRTTAAVHPFSVDTRQMNSRQQAAIYNMYQYTPYPILPDVKFKRLPFFDVMDDLLKPSSLLPQNNQRIQEGTFYFHLTPQQATDIASSRDIRPGSKCEYIKQVQMRFCLLETSCEQEDCFPPSVNVKVNNKMCPLPNPVPTNKPGVEPKRPPRPVNITSMVKLSPTVANTIHVSWAADFGRGYAITVALVHKRNSSDLLQRLKSRGVKHSDHTRGLIKEKLKEDDCEIATTSLRVSLICPLGKMRMSTPCRAMTCQHLQCFDASLFLQMNERKPTWNCPVCDKPAIYDNLVIDGYFQEILSSPILRSDTNEIQLHKDGSWSIQGPETKVIKSEKVPVDDSLIEIISDDVEVVSSGNATSSTDKRDPETNSGKPEAKRQKDVVDLTLSDSDDDEPLAKRRNISSNPKPDSTIKFSDTTSISSTSSVSRVSTTPGPSSVSSSGYPASPSVITLDSPSPPRSPHADSAQQAAAPTLPSCMMASNGSATTPPATVLYGAGATMPRLDVDADARRY